MSGPTRLLCMGALTVVVAGCEAPAPTTRNFNRLRLTSVSQAEAFDAAVKAMQERFRIAKMDRSAGMITSVPKEASEIVPRGRVGDVVGVPRRVRTVAITKVTGSDSYSDVWCKVLIEEFESEDRHLFEQEMSRDDIPTATAADREGSTTPEQNAVWRAVRRDKQAERGVLQAVEEILHLNGDAEG